MCPILQSPPKDIEFICFIVRHNGGLSPNRRKTPPDHLLPSVVLAAIEPEVIEVGIGGPILAPKDIEPIVALTPASGVPISAHRARIVRQCGPCIRLAVVEIQGDGAGTKSSQKVEAIHRITRHCHVLFMPVRSWRLRSARRKLLPLVGLSVIEIENV